MHGTNKDDGIISVLEFCERYGHTERVGRLAADIVKIERHGKVIWEKD